MEYYTIIIIYNNKNLTCVHHTKCNDKPVITFVSEVGRVSQRERAKSVEFGLKYPTCLDPSSGKSLDPYYY